MSLMNWMIAEEEVKKEGSRFKFHYLSDEIRDEDNTDDDISSKDESEAREKREE